MAEANWMMGIELPGVQRGLVKQSVNMKLATEVSEADFEDLFTKELIDAVAGLITPHATLFREEDPINGEVFAGIEFGFIPDLNEYRKQLHDALLDAYAAGQGPRSPSTEILETEYDKEFDKLRENRMVLSFYKYGPVKENYENNLIEAIPSLEKRLKMYKETGNTELLADIANFAMIEHMFPQHPDAHFVALDDGKSHIVGMGVNQMKEN